MSHLKSGRGIILKKTKYSESDLIIQIILTTGEKLSVMARGAMKSKKRFAGGVLDPSQYVQIQYRDQGERKLGILEEAQILDGFERLRSDYDKMDLALQIIQWITKISQEGDTNSEGLFNLLGHALKSLQDAKDFQLYKTVFELKLLHQQGVLDHEAWMAPVFQSSFKDWQRVESELKISKAQTIWVENQLLQYLQSASTHSQG